MNEFLTIPVYQDDLLVRFPTFHWVSITTPAITGQREAEGQRGCKKAPHGSRQCKVRTVQSQAPTQREVVISEGIKGSTDIAPISHKTFFKPPNSL